MGLAGSAAAPVAPGWFSLGCFPARATALTDCSRFSLQAAMVMLCIIMRTSPNISHLPPHLVEVCDILARGLMRLRSRTADESARVAAATGARGEFRLHSVPRQRVSANRTTRRAT